MRAVGYARVSSDEQKKKHTIQPQLTIIEEYSNQKKYDFIKGYIDDGKSGTKERGRKIHLILEDAKNDLFDILLIVKWDRLYRNLLEQLQFLKELESLGKKVYAIQDTNESLSRDIVSRINQEESERNSERTKRGLQGKIRQGIFQSRLKGYVKFKTPKSNKQKIKVDDVWGSRVTEAVNLYEQNVPWKDISKTTRLSWTTFVRIIHRPEYTSYVTDGEKRYPIAYPPLFTEKSRTQCLLRYWKEAKKKRDMTDTEFEQLRKEKIQELV